jgi:predicted nucleotide-binding protein
VKIIAPSGKITILDDAPLDATTTYDFKAREAGVHRIVIHSGSHVAACNGVTLPVNAVSLSGAFHFVYATGKLYFQVPASVKEFAIRVAGDGGLEQARAIITNAEGKVVIDKDNIARTQQFVLTRDDATKPEIWSLQLARPTRAVIEDVHVMLDGVPCVFAASPETLLVPAE